MYPDTIEEKLDFVLLWLYAGRTIPNADNIDGYRITFSIMIDGLFPKNPDSKGMLLDRLFLNKHIEINSDNIPVITAEGILFLLEQGGYSKKKRFQIIDERIKEKTLRKFTWDRILTIIAIIISLVSLGVSFAVARHKW